MIIVARINWCIITHFMDINLIGDTYYEINTNIVVYRYFELEVNYNSIE